MMGMQKCGEVSGDIKMIWKDVQMGVLVSSYVSCQYLDIYRLFWMSGWEYGHQDKCLDI